MDAFLPGVAGWEPIYNNPALWHFRFNGHYPEELVRGRERTYFEHYWNDFAADKTRSIPESDRKAYTAAYARPGRMRAGWAYFASFPQWLTLAAHLDDRDGALERLATQPNPAQAARDGAASAGAALPPAVCYHVYANLAGRVVASPTVLTAQGTCWRHEGARHAPLERGWAFTMREVVCIGTPEDTAAAYVAVVKPVLFVGSRTFE